MADNAFIYVVDSAMITEENLKEAELFISRIATTYNECDRSILDAVGADKWTEVGCISVTPVSKKRPNAAYRIQEQTMALYGIEYRVVVVHSSAHDRRREKRLEKELANLLKQANSLAKEINKKASSAA